MSTIKTYNQTTGKHNGFVIPIWNVNEEPNERPDQVYVTGIAPRSCKGPHLHLKRQGRFTCVRGNVRIVWRDSYFCYHSIRIGDDYPSRRMMIPAGTPCALYNDADVEALVINCPSPSWSKDNPDEHPVTNWID